MYCYADIKAVHSVRCSRSFLRLWVQDAVRGGHSCGEGGLAAALVMLVLIYTYPSLKTLFACVVGNLPTLRICVPCGSITPARGRHGEVVCLVHQTFVLMRLWYVEEGRKHIQQARAAKADSILR